MSPREDGRPGLVQIQTWELQPAIPPPTARTDQRQLELPARRIHLSALFPKGEAARTLTPSRVRLNGAYRAQCGILHRK